MVDKRLPPGAFTTNETAVLLALMRRAGRASTVRQLADDAGLPVTCTYEALRWLKTEGVISWRLGRAATLLPLVRVVEFTRPRVRRARA